jgi:hypothetical protein
MARKRKSAILPVRLKKADLRAFREAAEAGGLPLWTWVRDRLRYAAREELDPPVGEECAEPLTVRSNPAGDAAS